MGEEFERGNVLLGKYCVESVVGRGGMAIVLKVTHVQLEEELAMKVWRRIARSDLDRSPRSPQRWLRSRAIAGTPRRSWSARLTCRTACPAGSNRRCTGCHRRPP